MRNKKFDYRSLTKEASRIKTELSILDYFFSLENSGQLKFEGKKGKEHFFGFKEQRTGSISINESRNMWFDHSSGLGGDIIRAVEVFENKTFVEAIEKLRFKTPVEANIERMSQTEECHYQIVKEIEIAHPALKNYIISRGLDPEYVSRFCREIHWRHKEKFFFGIGLRNDSGGWSVRSQIFKGNLISSNITTIKVGDRVGAIKIFEGMFDFLSFVKLFPKESFIAKILNSTSNFSLKLMENLNQESVKKNLSVSLYLDNDKEGDEKTAKALGIISGSSDKRELYIGFEDMNDKIIHNNKIKR